ncbi:MULTISPECIES: PhzF family phenazine biosynthesis protein [Methanosarcina]|uniref:Putative isomerase yddE, PhzC-PhzF family n=1 Tax=Methanosarcina mazei LYC TaxID=1434114 RepID=A0A0E3LVP9_METMZ|nr:MULTISPECIES: PhzF family phenazine biosynthesis protein [Methanosarcina]AKB67401.1 putative isomerase yddE, PhzC-PhzF family [Methanosarcina mazei LYC]
MKIYQVDAFTEKPFSGNPAGVCVLNEKLDEKIMQNIAHEINLSETAFLVKSNKEYDLRYDLRWFRKEKLTYAGMQHWQAPIFCGRKDF